jgi:hypothetical protein
LPPNTPVRITRIAHPINVIAKNIASRADVGFMRIFYSPANQVYESYLVASQTAKPSRFVVNITP